MRIPPVLVAVLLATLSVSVSAQETPAPTAAPRFDITNFVVEGNTLLKAEEIDKRVAPFTGKQKDFGDVQRALEALQEAYQEQGYGAVQVILPEQALEQGVVRFKVIEGRVSKITIEGNQFHDEANVRGSLPALKESTPPKSRDIAANLRAANENPSKQTTVLFKTGEKEGDIEATVKVTDEKTWKGFVSLDNTGTTETGRYRLGVGYQNANLGNRDQVLTLQYITSPEKVDKVTILGAGYHIPLYAWGDSIDLIAAYSDVDSGTLQQVGGGLNVSGRGTILAARYNQSLRKIGETYEHKLSYGLDYRAYEPSCTTAVGGQPCTVNNLNQPTGASKHVTVHPLSVTYGGQWLLPGTQANFYVAGVANIAGGTDGRDMDFALARTGANADYSLLRYGFGVTNAFGGDWQLRAAFNGQYTNSALIPGEQFGIGGATSVRGFLEREVANDRGYNGNLEIYTPDFAGKLGWQNIHARALAFYDFGSVSPVQPPRTAGESISSAGFGLRLTSGKNVSVRVDYATVLDDDRGQGNPSTQGSGDWMLHFGFAYVF